MVSASGLTWRTVPLAEAQEHWDSWLTQFSDSHIRQSVAWATLKTGAWRPVFTAYFNGVNPIALGLCLINGGPVYVKSRPHGQNLAALEGYLAGLKEHAASYSRPVLRLRAEVAMDLQAQLVLRQAGFMRPLMPLDTGLTYVVDLTQSLDAIHANLERSWRQKLKQADIAAPAIATGRDRALLERYLPLHNALLKRKGLAAQRLSLADLEAMVARLGERLTFFVLSVQGKDGCGGAVWNFGGKGVFALSAANDWGLRHNLPNAMYWHAIRLLKDGGATRFDLAGIDPRLNWGVYNFKRGLNAPPIEALGEWEWSPSDWRRRAFNAALWLRRDKLA
jgi:lipid II:glycine glycyltransferase (peptidoglycan interpeptide bridge formation enzyme)